MPLLGLLGEVAAEALERLVAVLGVLVGHAVRAAHLLDRLGELVARGAGVDGRLAGEGEQQVLGRDVLVAEPARLLVGAPGAGRIRSWPSAGAAPASPVTVGRASSASLARAANPLRIGARAPQHRHDDAAVLLEQRDEQVLGRDLRVAARAGQPLRGGKRLLGLDGEAICLHKI